MSSTPERLVVSNTSPLLYLHQAGQLDLMRKLYGRIWIPPAVRLELRAGAEKGVAVPDLSELEWIVEQPLRDRSLLPAIVDLGAGEAEAIAIALTSPGSLLILDDQLGRRIARLSRLTVTGTLGVLVKAKQAGFLQRVTPVIDSLKETTMYLTPHLIEMVLAEADEI
jgi:predicted nucleic acid-binding protein